MLAGSFDRCIQLQHRVLAARNAQGEPVATWTTYATIWASKLDLKAREVLSANQPINELTTTWNIRFRSDVLATDRIVFGTLSYNIRQIAEIGRRKGLQIMATALVT